MAALTTWACPTCGHLVEARGASYVAHPCPRRRTKAGQPRMTEMEPTE